MSLGKRLAKLEARVRHGQPAAELSISDLMAGVEQALDLPPVSLPRTPEEAYTRGFQSMAAALADALGITLQELKEALS